MGHTVCATLVVVFVLSAAPAWAIEIDGCHPPCGAPGDVVYVQGSGFTDPPTVTLGGRRAEVLRSGENALLCRVPDGLPEGVAALRVDGHLARLAFQALSAGRPVVHGLSTATGTPGQTVFVHGRRLQAGAVLFLDRRQHAAGSAPLVGGTRAATFRIPDDLAPAVYRLVLTNGEHRHTGPCSPTLEVVAPGKPEVYAIHPARAIPSRSATPGECVELVGADLGPAGSCRVRWKGGDGRLLTVPARSNGYDRVKTTVPLSLRPGVPAEVALASGVVIPSLPYEPPPIPDPVIVTLEPATGPPGSCVAVRGSGLPRRAGELVVELIGSASTHRAEVLYGCPGGLGGGSAWYVRIPEDLRDAEYEVRVRVGSRVSEPAPWRVTDRPLTTARMWPRLQLGTEPARPVVIEGTGFGGPPTSDGLRVVWIDGSRELEGRVLLRTDDRLRVLPPQAIGSSSPSGPWAVFVIRSVGEEERSAYAGTWAVCGR